MNYSCKTFDPLPSEADRTVEDEELQGLRPFFGALEATYTAFVMLRSNLRTEIAMDKYRTRQCTLSTLRIPTMSDVHELKAE